jgi:hypothetical protein
MEVSGSDVAGDLRAPAAEHQVDQHGAGPFVTWVMYRRPDGAVARWESREQRKHHNRLGGTSESTWWAPGAIGWWIGVLFMIGSLCFALGALPGYVEWVGSTTDDVTFFIGSIFFTSAAVLQYLEVVNADPVDHDPSVRRRVRFFAWQPRRIDWWASGVQLVGTVFFNISTFAAMDASLSAEGVNRLVWRPDVYGSACFLIASELAFAEVGHRWVSWRPRVRSWRIASLNLAGSVAFGVSAFAARIVSDSGQPANVELVNLGTFLGAIGFLVGAFLLLPERTDSLDPTGPGPSASLTPATS